jgi:hypothetical protein
MNPELWNLVERKDWKIAMKKRNKTVSFDMLEK